MGLSRQLPNTDAGRTMAMNKAAQKIAISAPADVPLSAETQARLAALRPTFNTNMTLRGQALAQQVVKTPLKDAQRKTAGSYLLHYMEAHDNAALRGETGFTQGDRAFFQLEGTNHRLPEMNSDSDVSTWGPRVIDGDVLRLAAGRPAIPFPTIANVTSKYNTYFTTLGEHNLLKRAYDDAQEAIENMRVDADKLIKRMWNEIEAAFSEESDASKRRNGREWGIVYIITAGSVPSADDFSIMGTITDSVTGHPLADVLVTQISPEVVVLTDAAGRYFIPRGDAGTYALHVHKAGFAERDIAPVTVVDGVITTLDIQLVATGAVSGHVAGVSTPGPFNVSIQGQVGGTVTDGANNFTLTDIPAGAQVIVCSPVSNPANLQSQNITVVAGGNVVVSFVFA